MYKILGTDGKEYGPVSAEQIRRWMVEGRVNMQTRVQRDGETEWRALAEIPELAALAAPVFPPSGYSPGSSVLDQLSGPAIGLIVTAVIGLALHGMGLLGSLGSIAMSSLPNQNENPIAALLSGTRGAVYNCLGLVAGVVTLLGALKMKNAESYNWSMTASILAMIPCFSCCLVGIPIGIWAVIVLSKPEIKAAFSRIGY